MGKPIEPGGSFPLHFGLLQVYTQWVIQTITKAVRHTIATNIFVGNDLSGIFPKASDVIYIDPGSIYEEIKFSLIIN